MISFMVYFYTDNEKKIKNNFGIFNHMKKHLKASLPIFIQKFVKLLIFELKFFIKIFRLKIQKFHLKIRYL